MSAHVPEERGVAVYEEHANEGLVLSFNNMAMLGSCDGSSPISATYLVLKLSDDLLVAENDNKILCGAPTPERHPPTLNPESGILKTESSFHSWRARLGS